MQIKIERFDFNALFLAAKNNNLCGTDQLIMHLLQGQLTGEQIASIIAQADLQNKKSDQECVSCLLVLRAILHQEGLGGEVNHAAAMRCLQRAITLDNPLAYARQAIVYQQQSKHLVYYAYINRLLREGIQRNDATAMLVMAPIHYHAQKGDKALQLLQRASALHHPLAMNELAWFYYLAALEKKEKPDFLTILPLLARSAAKGCKLALENLGFLYHDSEGYIQNDEKAAELYRQAYHLSPVISPARFRELQAFYSNTSNKLAKYHLLMMLYAKRIEQHVLPFFKHARSSFILYLLDDTFLTNEQKTYYLKELINFYTKRHKTLRAILDKDKENQDNARAKNRLAHFSLEQARLPSRQQKEDIHFQLQLLDQVSSDCNYYSQVLAQKCDLLFMCFNPQHLDKFDQVLVLARVVGTHELLLQRQRRQLQFQQQLMMAYGANKYEKFKKKLAYLDKTMGDITRVLGHKGAMQDLPIDTSLTLSYQADWHDVDADIALLIYLQRRKLVDKLVPGLKRYYCAAKEILLGILKKINEEWPARGVFYRKSQPGMDAIRDTIIDLQKQNWPQLKILDAILHINQLASAHLCCDKKLKKESKKNQFFAKILIDIQQISLNVFAQPEKTLHTKGNSLPLLSM